MNNPVQFGVITNVCKGYAFARVMDKAGTVTSKEVFLGLRQFVKLDESRPTPWLTDEPNETTVPVRGDYIAFLFNTHPVHRGNATPAFKWGVLSNGEATTAQEGDFDTHTEADEPLGEENDSELEALAAGVNGRNTKINHCNARHGRARHKNPNQRRRQAA